MFLGGFTLSRPVSFVFREIFLHSNHGRPLEVTDVFFFLGRFVLNFVLDFVLSYYRILATPLGVGNLGCSFPKLNSAAEFHLYYLTMSGKDQDLALFISKTSTTFYVF